jgi:hypothetical protein
MYICLPYASYRVALTIMCVSKWCTVAASSARSLHCHNIYATQMRDGSNVLLAIVSTNTTWVCPWVFRVYCSSGVNFVLLQIFTSWTETGRMRYAMCIGHSWLIYVLWKIDLDGCVRWRCWREDKHLRGFSDVEFPHAVAVLTDHCVQHCTKTKSVCAADS